jgi:hypothetical protein
MPALQGHFVQSHGLIFSESGCGLLIVGINKDFRPYQKYLVIVFELECPTRFKAKCFVAPYGCDLRRHRTSAKELSNALLAVWTVVEINL